jgi:hypothetical protein
VTVSWFESQNQVSYGLSVAPQNRWDDENGVGHVSRSSGLLYMEASWARVSQSVLKTDGGTTAGGTHDTIMNVASSSSQRRTGRCDGLHRTLLPHLCHFHCIRS